MEDKIRNREQKVSEPRLYSRPCHLCRSGPPVEGRLHAYQNVLDGTFWFGVWQEDIAVGLGERLHSFFKPSVRGMKASVYTHDLAVPTGDFYET